MSEILLYSTDSTPIAAKLAGVDIVSQMGHVVVVKDTPHARDRAGRLGSAVKLLFRSQPPAASVDLLSAAEQLFVRAWLRQPADRLADAGAGLPWDTPGYKAP